LQANSINQQQTILRFPTQQQQPQQQHIQVQQQHINNNQQQTNNAQNVVVITTGGIKNVLFFLGQSYCQIDLWICSNEK
jgi:hypothetical protein